MKFKTGDKVIAIAGKDKGSTGRIGKVFKKTNKVIVEGINLVKKHIKPNANNQTGGIVSIEAPIHASNVMFVNEKTNKGSRVRIINETKEIKKVAPKKAKAKKD
jgi:large subunit ribosomal protein L24